MSQKVKANRLPLDSPIFRDRGTKVKWPTLRKAWLNNESVSAIQSFVEGRGRSIIFLDGTYKTNLNQWSDDHGPFERAIFYEFLIRHPRIKGGIFALSWIGNFHNGCIFHIAWQYPQVQCWHGISNGTAEQFFEKQAFKIYKGIAERLYQFSDYPMDAEVAEFINQDVK